MELFMLHVPAKELFMLLVPAKELFLLHVCNASNLTPVRQTAYLHTLKEKTKNFLTQVKFE